MDALGVLASTALEELREPLVELGLRWAESPNRPRPKQPILRQWDELLDHWIINSNLPLIMRDSRRRGKRATCSNGREVIFSDNSPANWSFGLALADDIPDIRSWNSDNIQDNVPLTFMTKGPAAKRDLNKVGWKICHIEAVSDRRRISIKDSPNDRLEGAFRRLLSPRNMFVIPKMISGAGELLEVISAVIAFERSVGVGENPEPMINVS